VVEETWVSRELPILRVALEQIEAGETFVKIGALKEQLGLSDVSMGVAIRSLEKAGYIEAASLQRGPIAIKDVTERTRRELGAWPSADGLLEQLVAALTDAANAEPEPEKKTKLRATADVLAGMARDIAVSAIASRIG
jgi:DNA-binding MarR family transcriptional regulator